MKTYNSSHKKSDCLLFHKFETDSSKSTSVTQYEECRVCGYRRVSTLEGIYQPIDFAWLCCRK